VARKVGFGGVTKEGRLAFAISQKVKKNVQRGCPHLPRDWGVEKADRDLMDLGDGMDGTGG